MVAVVLCVGTSGFRDPTLATLPFVTALAAFDAGNEAQIALMGDATFLMKDAIAERVHGEGWPPLKQLLARVVAKGIPIFL